jgi:ferredoxin-thioredoxin reductase catalytic subunit/rubredoxin
MSAQETVVTPEEVRTFYLRLKPEIESAGYHFGPELEMTLSLLEGCLINEKRYGYACCPCRLAARDRAVDLDIICPCDYRDADIAEFGACYCGLYVSTEVAEGKKPLRSIPERRPSEEERQKRKAGRENPGAEGVQTLPGGLSYPVWRCKVCGYLCAREAPPEVCPICKVKKDRFERFI